MPNSACRLYYQVGGLHTFTTVTIVRAHTRSLHLHIANKYTRRGNMRAPSRKLLCDWSWQSVSAELIKSSIKFCAITTPIDGSEDP